MPRPLAPHRTATFLGASDEIGVELPGDAAKVIRNAYRDRGQLVGRKGTAPHTDRDLAGVGDQIDGLYWARIGTDDHLFAVFGGHVYETFPPAPPFLLVDGSDRFTAGNPVTFAWLDQKVYVGDGTNPNIRLDATSAAVALPDAPGTGMTATAVAGGSLTSGVVFTYRVVFLSADGNETAPSAVVTASATSAGNQRIQLANIPQPASGQDAAGIRIYRIAASGTTHRSVATLSVGAASYLDDIADASLGDSLSSNDRRAMPPSALLITHQGRLLGACSNDPDFDRQTLYISNFREPWWCPAAPDLEDPNDGAEHALQGPAAGEITGMASQGDRAYIFTWDACHVLTGDQPIDFALREFVPVGCVAHRTIARAKSRLIWLAPDGVYEMRPGAEVRRISDPIRGFLSERTAEELSGAHAFIYDDRYYLCCAGEARVLDLEYSEGPLLQWGEVTEWDWNCSTVASSGMGTLPRIFAGRTGTPRVWELETGEDDDGEPIPVLYRSPHWDLGNPGREKRIHYVGATFAVGEGEAIVTLAKGTGGVVETYTVDLETPAEEDGEIVRLFQRAVEDARSEYFQMEVTHQKTAPFRMLALDNLWSLAT